VASVAAVAQCLVASLDARHDAGDLPTPPRTWTVRENKWLACRYGIEAELIVDDLGARRPARQLIAELIEDLAPVADELGCADALADVRWIVDRGPSYARQRQVMSAGGTPHDVVAGLVAELADAIQPSEHPLPATPEDP
jgi:carboxylate-amine ligase